MRFLKCPRSKLIYTFIPALAKMNMSIISRAVALRRISKMTPYIRYGIRRIVSFTV